MIDHTKPFQVTVLVLVAAAVLAARQTGIAQHLPMPKNASESEISGGFGLDDFLNLSLDRNPGLRQSGLEIDAAQGRALQAGMYPNPTISVGGEEIGRRGGIQTFPQLSQEIVRGGKLGLSRAVAEREVDQAQLALLRQRNALFTSVRLGYYEVLAVQKRIEVLDELAKLATQAFENAEKLFKQQQIAELDLLPFQVELERLRADTAAARRELAAAWGRLAATVGSPEMPAARVFGSLESPLPEYTLESARATMLEVHPEVRIAQVGITRAQLAVQREQAQVVPNVTLAGGIYDFNDRENQATYQVSVPIPVWNRNQGNIRAAQAELGRATQEVVRVQNELSTRLWTAFGQYSAARERSERYRTAILPNATRTYRLSVEAFQGGQFQYLRVLQAQRSIAEANLEYIRALSDAWRGASEIAGLLQQ